jgi:AcrR family transcriptional regulator
MSTAKAQKLEGSARDRLLAAANELFYDEGVHTVGIDRVIDRAGVAKASLYSAFGSKDELVKAYLEQRAEARKQRITDGIAKQIEPRAKILAVFDLLGELAASPKFRGCAFVNASAEGPRDQGKVAKVTAEMRTWIHQTFAGLARDLGAEDPGTLGRQLVVLYDGAVVGASLDRTPAVARQARAMAEVLLDAAARKKRR